MVSYFGQRETDVRLESLITTLQAQIQIVEDRIVTLDDTDKTLNAAITAVKDTAQLALDSAKKVDTGVMVMIGQNNEIMAALRDVRSVLFRHYGGSEAIQRSVRRR